MPGRDAGRGARGAPLRARFVELLRPYFEPTDAAAGAPALLPATLAWAIEQPHVMPAQRARLLAAVAALLRAGLEQILDAEGAYGAVGAGGAAAAASAAADDELLRAFVAKWTLYALLWGLGAIASAAARPRATSSPRGSRARARPRSRTRAARRRAVVARARRRPEPASLLELRVDADTAAWGARSSRVPRADVDARRVADSSAVVQTADILRHADVIRAWLAARAPLVLCGPPGSGKTMTLSATLGSMPGLVLASLDFSRDTTPDLVLKTFAQYCEYVKTARGVVLQPHNSFGADKWLVVFCDEVNLPARDKYGTQRVIAFLRELCEQRGFWRTKDNTWVSVRRVQFVGACNPPGDAGRTPLPPRFLARAPVLLVDFPRPDSLRTIYGAINAALLKTQPSLKPLATPLTDAMIDFYGAEPGALHAPTRSRSTCTRRASSRAGRARCTRRSRRSTRSSPTRSCGCGRTRGCRSSATGSRPTAERAWCEASLDDVARAHFDGYMKGPNGALTLERPLLYSSWLTKDYRPVERGALRTFMAARLKVFYEEELDVPLVVFDEVLDHALRIDAVLRTPMGHALLVGDSGVGKTVLSRFVAWMNGLSVVQIVASRRYTLAQFDDDLRAVLRRAGVGGEKIAFVFDEANALSSGFLERMNALLASGEVPGLFEGDERAQLLAAAREAAQRDGALVDAEDELFARFTAAVQRNLHVLFTMNPAAGDFAGRAATSPALFNRCVVDWFGTWSDRALAQVAREMTADVDTGSAPYAPPPAAAALLGVVADALLDDGGAAGAAGAGASGAGGEGGAAGEFTMRHALVAAVVHFHLAVRDAVAQLSEEGAAGGGGGGGRRRRGRRRGRRGAAARAAAAVREPARLPRVPARVRRDPAREARRAPRSRSATCTRGSRRSPRRTRACASSRASSPSPRAASRPRTSSRTPSCSRCSRTRPRPRRARPRPPS